MSLRHLVIGTGNMGRRHGEILTSLGDLVEYADLEFDPSKLDKYPSVDSLLLCTPAETHVGLIEKLSYTKLPLFVEKPVLVFGDKEPKYPGVSMVACNWRWCPCFDGGDLFLGYPANQKYLALDLVHFFDKFAPRASASQVCSDADTYCLRMRDDKDLLCHVDLFKNCTTNFSIVGTSFGVRLIHQIPCNMFVDQMKVWRDVISGSPSPNPIDLATIATKALISLIDNAVVVPSKPLH